MATVADLVARRERASCGAELGWGGADWGAGSTCDSKDCSGSGGDGVRGGGSRCETVRWASAPENSGRR